MPGGLEFIFVDIVNGTAGGAGDAQNPRDSMANAHALMVSTGIRRLFLVADGFHTLPALDWSNVEFWGAGRSFGGGPVLDANGQSLDGCVVHRMTVFGGAAGQAYTIRNGTMALTSDCQIYAFESVVTLTNSTRGGMRLIRCTTGEVGTSQAAIFDFANHNSGATREVTMGPLTGKVILRNMTLANLQVEICGDCEVELESTCTTGVVIPRGPVKVVDNAQGTVVDYSNAVQAGPEVQVNSRFEGPTTFHVNAWLERGGSHVLGVSNATLELRSESGSLLKSTSVSSPDAQGVFKLAISGVNIGSEADQMFYWRVTMDDPDGVPRSGITGLTGRAEA